MRPPGGARGVRAAEKEEGQMPGGRGLGGAGLIVGMGPVVGEISLVVVGCVGATTNRTQGQLNNIALKSREGQKFDVASETLP